MRCDHAMGWAGRCTSRSKKVALIAGCLTLSHACAMQPRSNVFVHLTNASGAMVSVCNADGTLCNTLPPGATTLDRNATGRAHVTFIGEWITNYGVRLCGKFVPLRTMITEPAVSEDWNSLTFRLAISRHSYQRQCG